MASSPDMPERILGALVTGKPLTCSALALQLRVPERTVRDHLAALVTRGTVHRRYVYEGAVGAYRYSLPAARVASR